jgi:hypothetical protein
MVGWWQMRCGLFTDSCSCNSNSMQHSHLALHSCAQASLQAATSKQVRHCQWQWL